MNDPSRRTFLSLGAVAAGAMLSAKELAAQRVIRPRGRRPEPPAAPGDLTLRLVQRVTNGVTEEEMALAASLGFHGYLEHHLDAFVIEDSAVEATVASAWPLVLRDAQELYQEQRGLVQNELQQATLYRAAFSRRQLYERMVHFWSDHFNIYIPKVGYLKLIDDREVVRAHALGSFRGMLWASAQSPAMLEYLDNTRSRGGNVNQNYARELMELHTLGVDGGYTQTDVEEVSRAFTGWTLAGRGNGFRFDASGHDFGPKTVLGIPLPATPSGDAGVQDGENVLEILLAHESTARFIASKMIRWLLRYDPPAALVDTVAATFTRTDGDVRAMIRDILTPDNLREAPAKYRQPYQLALAQLRATRPTGEGVVGAVNRQLPALGQPLFLWEDPDGYPDRVDWWGGMILQRWNFSSYLTARRGAAFDVDVAPLMAVRTPDGVVDAIDRRAFGGMASPELKHHLRQFLAAAPISDTTVREGFALALSSNEFQWY